jgi:hypothetical protein
VRSGPAKSEVLRPEGQAEHEHGRGGRRLSQRRQITLPRSSTDEQGEATPQPAADATNNVVTVRQDFIAGQSTLLLADPPARLRLAFAAGMASLEVNEDVRSSIVDGGASGRILVKGRQIKASVQVQGLWRDHGAVERPVQVLQWLGNVSFEVITFASAGHAPASWAAHMGAGRIEWLELQHL